MNGQSFIDPFIFNVLIDPATLYSLYENDYVYMEEIFKTTLDHWDADFQSIEAGFQKGDLDALRRAIHKFKPVFGFLGMPAVQEKCRLLEEQCRSSSTVAELQNDLNKLLHLIKECKIAVEDDHRKLTVFNKP